MLLILNFIFLNTPNHTNDIIKKGVPDTDVPIPQEAFEEGKILESGNQEDAANTYEHRNTKSKQHTVHIRIGYVVIDYTTSYLASYMSVRPKS